MTHEEAIEVILGADAWEACPECMGYSFKHTMDAENMMVSDPFICPKCRGSGCKLKLNYRRACKVLKRRPPKAKPGQWTAMERMKQRDLDKAMSIFGRNVAKGLGVPLKYLGYSEEPDEEPESSPFR